MPKMKPMMPGYEKIMPMPKGKGKGKAMPKMPMKPMKKK